MGNGCLFFTKKPSAIEYNIDTVLKRHHADTTTDDEWAIRVSREIDGKLEFYHSQTKSGHYEVEATNKQLNNHYPALTYLTCLLFILLTASLSANIYQLLNNHNDDSCTALSELCPDGLDSATSPLLALQQLVKQCIECGLTLALDTTNYSNSSNGSFFNGSNRTNFNNSMIMNSFGPLR